MDAKDILGLPKSGPVADNKRVRAPKETPKKPATVSREVYALTGGLPPIIASVDFKQRQVPSKKVSWQWLPFTNSARSDNLQLCRWTRLSDGVAPSGDYPFAKYNTSVSISKYTDEEYNKHLTDPNWTREETDLLFDLCQQFDLRFIIIADRFPPPERTVEELKQRYYSASKAVILSRAVTPDDVVDHPLVKDPYNFNHEVDRKRALSLLLSQSRQQDQEDEEVLAEAKRITEARLAAKAAEQAELQSAAAGTNSASQVPGVDTSPAATPSIPLAPRGHRVFLRGANLQQMIHNLVSSAGVKVAKRVEQLVEELGVRAEPRVPTESICREHLELRKEILALLNLQKQVTWRDSDSSAYADGPSTPKMGRPFRGADGGRLPVGASGERAGKRDHKRKAPARVLEAPPSPPQQKRARKLKSSTD